MTKGELVTKMARDGGITKAQAEKALGSFVSEVTSCLSAGEKVTLLGFGTFRVVERSSRAGRNPRTGETITIPVSKIVRFKPGKGMSNKVK